MYRQSPFVALILLWLPYNEVHTANVSCFAVRETSLFAGTTGYGVFRSTNNGASWRAVNTGLDNTWVLTLLVSGPNIFAGTFGGLFRSTNDGTEWSRVNTGLPPTNGVGAIAAADASLFATTSQVIIRSTDGGESWQPVNRAGIEGAIVSLLATSTTLFAGTFGGGQGSRLFYTTNSGTDWVPTSLTYFNVTEVGHLSAPNANIFAGTLSGGVFRSTDIGASWTPVNTGLRGSSITALATRDTSIFAASQGVFLSTNNGATWTELAGLGAFYFESLVAYESNIFVSTEFNGVFRSTDNGNTWEPSDSGLVLTFVHPSLDEQPQYYHLEQNYPNPFNPSTTIKYDLPKDSRVSLKLFNMLGQEVKTLVNEEQKAGYKSVQWNANNFASGVYFYRIQAGDFVASKKLLLLR